MAPEALERILSGLLAELPPDLEARVLAGRARNEDAVVLRLPPGKALVQTVDILAPVVNDPRAFGRIAAANALSDVYAVGGEPWSAMNICCFPTCLLADDPEEILAGILRGGLEAIIEAGAVLAGGHSVQDDELKYGLAVSGLIDPERIAVNSGLIPGQKLILTKPLGTGVLSTAVKAQWDGSEEAESELCRWCGRLNKEGGRIIAAYGLSAATDITGFGLGGHLLEMARASGVCVAIDAESVPLLPGALDYARLGFIPSGSHANRVYCAPYTTCAVPLDEALESLLFDAQTSGGLVLAVTPEQVSAVSEELRAAGDLAACIGEVLPPGDGAGSLLLR